MIKAVKQTREINSFVFTPIPSPRDLYLRYGERKSNGLCLSQPGEFGNAQVVAMTTIDQMINAQRLAEDLQKRG